MTVLEKLMTDAAINRAVVDIVSGGNADDIFYIIEEFTAKATAYAKEINESKEQTTVIATRYLNQSVTV